MAKHSNRKSSHQVVTNDEPASPAPFVASSGAAALPPTITDEGSLALESMREEIAALDSSNLVRMNIDYSKSCSTVLGVLGNVAAYEADLGQLKFLDFPKVKKLRTYALGALTADIIASGDDEVHSLADQANVLKQDLLVAADALAAKGILDAGRIADIRAGSGYLDLARDCVALSRLFQEKWGVIENKTAVSRADVDRANALGTKLLEALGERAAGVKHENSMDVRQRAFTLLVNAYEETRRGISFLRWWQDDLETIVPSLYSKKRSSATSSDVATDAPAAGAPAAGSAAPAQPAGSAPATASGATAATPPAMTAGTGAAATPAPASNGASTTATAAPSNGT